MMYFVFGALLYVVVRHIFKHGQRTEDAMKDFDFDKWKGNGK